MYAPFFGLSKEPFSISPDPRFLFMSEQHREALAHLLYGLGGGGGFVLLTGEIGAGKTTVFRCFLDQVPARCAVAYVFNPKLTAVELLQTVCGEFGLQPPSDTTSVKAHVDALNVFLLSAHAQGKQAVLVIDEAQALSADVLEQLRLLTNLETAERKLLQIVLIGQPELRDMLARPQLEQLAQRVIARFHLGALTLAETRQYIRHRLSVAGPNAPLPFDAVALKRIHTLSAGVPRRINLLADRALLGAYAQSRSMVDKRTVDRAAREVFGTTAGAGAGHGWRAAWALPFVGGATVVVLLGLGAAWWLHTATPSQGGAFQRAGLAPSGPVTGTRSAATETVAGKAAAASASATDVSTSAAPSASTSALASASSVRGNGDNASVPASTAGAEAVSNDAGPLLAAAHADIATAWRELALRWNVAIGEGDPCVVAAQAQLACFRSNGGLAVVRQLARPGLLTLRRPDGSAVHAVLTGFTESNATLQVAGKRFVLGLPALAAAWRGDYATLWRTPAGWREGALADANTRAITPWLEQRLAGAGFPTSADGSKPLRDRIYAFQLSQGLPADGVAGPMTVMRLGRADVMIAAAPAGQSASASAVTSAATPARTSAAGAADGAFIEPRLQDQR